MMGFFKRGSKDQQDTKGEVTRPLVGRAVYCRVCNANRSFTRCWRRMGYVRQCPCCALEFADLAAIYRLAQPQCPRCAEPLEVPDFDYGLCDTCGSKFEIMEGTKPGLLPNRAQRAEMEKHGRTNIQRP